MDTLTGLVIDVVAGYFWVIEIGLFVASLYLILPRLQVLSAHGIRGNEGEAFAVGTGVITLLLMGLVQLGFLAPQSLSLLLVCLLMGIAFLTQEFASAWGLPKLLLGLVGIVFLALGLLGAFVFGKMLLGY